MRSEKCNLSIGYCLSELIWRNWFSELFCESKSSRTPPKRVQKTTFKTIQFFRSLVTYTRTVELYTYTYKKFV